MTPETGKHDFHLYGRRMGRPLRPGRRALLGARLPGVGIALPETGMVRPERLFPTRPRAIWLEIGFGGGEHLVWQAARNPDVGLIGCEPFVNGVVSLLAHLETLEDDNVRIFPDDARLLLERLPPACLDRVFILFPDPWPKARHHKRRIVSPRTLDRLAVLMHAGAELRLATDDVDYLRAMLETVLAHPAFTWPVRGPEDWRQRPADWPPTRYEQKALEQGRQSVYLRFLRRGEDR